MSILTVKGLCKRYPGFRLQDVTFSVEAGSITGFIGRNGAGKTTTLKSILGLVHPDAGTVECFGLDYAAHETEIKQRIGYVVSTDGYYKKKKIRTITNVTRTFYPNWDEDAYRHYLEVFHLDEEKSPSQLSAGMNVKYSISLALSHRAELLILDEATSALDTDSERAVQAAIDELMARLTVVVIAHRPVARRGASDPRRADERARSRVARGAAGRLHAAARQGHVDPVFNAHHVGSGKMRRRDHVHQKRKAPVHRTESSAGLRRRGIHGAQRKGGSACLSC